jgi:hypothetical protein
MVPHNGKTENERQSYLHRRFLESRHKGTLFQENHRWQDTVRRLLILCNFQLRLGLCCHRKSSFYLETVFEHFGCEKHVGESWESRSFQENPRLLIDRSELIGLLKACVWAIDGRKGIGVVSRDVRRLYLEIKQLLAIWDKAEDPRNTNPK